MAAGPLNPQGRSEGRSRGRRHAGLDSARRQPQGAPGRCVLAPTSQNPPGITREGSCPGSGDSPAAGSGRPCGRGPGWASRTSPRFSRAQWSRGCRRVAALLPGLDPHRAFLWLGPLTDLTAAWLPDPLLQAREGDSLSRCYGAT